MILLLWWAVCTPRPGVYLHTKNSHLCIFFGVVITDRKAPIKHLFINTTNGRSREKRERMLRKRWQTHRKMRQWKRCGSRAAGMTREAGSEGCPPLDQRSSPLPFPGKKWIQETMGFLVSIWNSSTFSDLNDKVWKTLQHLESNCSLYIGNFGCIFNM